MNKILAEEKIPNQQLFFLVILGMASSMVYMTSLTVLYAGRAGLIANILGILINIPSLIWFVSLTKKHPNRNIFEILDASCGKVASWIFAVLSFGLNLTMALLLLTIFNGFIKVFYLPKTPGWLLSILFISIGTLFSMKSMKIIGMFSQGILSSVLIVYYGLTLPFIVTEAKWSLVYPPLPESLSNFLLGFLLSAGTTSEVLLLLFPLAGQLIHDKNTLKTVIGSNATWLIVYLASTIPTIAMIGYEAYASTYASYAYIFTVIEIKNFLRGFELLILFVFEFFFMARLPVYIYALQQSVARIVHKNSIGTWNRFFTMFALIGPSIWLNSYNKAYFANAFMDEYVIVPFVLIILLFIAIGTSLKKQEDAG